MPPERTRTAHVVAVTAYVHVVVDESDEAVDITVHRGPLIVAPADTARVIAEVTRHPAEDPRPVRVVAPAWLVRPHGVPVRHASWRVEPPSPASGAGAMPAADRTTDRVA